MQVGVLYSVSKIPPCSGVPCLCLSVWNTFIIGGYGNGQLRLYDSESGIRVVEVSAHARPVLAIDVASSAGIVSQVKAIELHTNELCCSLDVVYI